MFVQPTPVIHLVNSCIFLLLPENRIRLVIKHGFGKSLVFRFFKHLASKCYPVNDGIKWWKSQKSELPYISKVRVVWRFPFLENITSKSHNIHIEGWSGNGFWSLFQLYEVTTNFLSEVTQVGLGREGSLSVTISGPRCGAWSRFRTSVTQIGEGR